MELLPVHQLKIKWLLYAASTGGPYSPLTMWEQDFLSSVRFFKKVTIDQTMKIDEIYTKVRANVY